MTQPEREPELRPAYRTLSEPTTLFGVALSGWAAILVAVASGYGWLLISPLPWRLNASLVTIGLGAPVSLLLLREALAISPVRLLGAALRWRIRPSRITASTPVAGGAVRLTTAPEPVGPLEPDGALPWIDRPGDAVPSNDGHRGRKRR